MTEHGRKQQDREANRKRGGKNPPFLNKDMPARCAFQDTTNPFCGFINRMYREKHGASPNRESTVF